MELQSKLDDPESDRAQKHICLNNTVWKQAIHPIKWREKFPAMKIEFLFMPLMWIPHICCY